MSVISCQLSVISIRIANRQKRLAVDRRCIRRAIRAILADAHVANAQISVAIVDDVTIAALHGEFLHDPTPTDVLSFVLEQSPACLEGEVVVSAETAAAAAPRFACTPGEELLRYVIHGMLHLTGHDDRTAAQRRRMRAHETEYLARAMRDG